MSNNDTHYFVSYIKMNKSDKEGMCMAWTLQIFSWQLTIISEFIRIWTSHGISEGFKDIFFLF